MVQKDHNDDTKSLWLGSLRKPMRYAAIFFTALALLLYIGLILAHFFTPEAYGMFEMIRPEGRPIVSVTLWTMAGALFFASIYLSDTRGAIEIEPTGFIDTISLVLARAAMIMTAFIVIVMFYEVVSRYVFARPTLWANELSLWLASFVLLLAGQYAMQQRSHIRIFVIYDMLPRWAQKTADVVSLFLLLVFVFALIWGGFADAQTRFLRLETFGTAWDPPIPGIVKPAILIVIIMVAIQAVSNLIMDWNKEPEHQSYDDVDQEEIENIRRTLEN